MNLFRIDLAHDRRLDLASPIRDQKCRLRKARDKEPAHKVRDMVRNEDYFLSWNLRSKMRTEVGHNGIGREDACV